MNIILFDTPARKIFYPLVTTRAVADLLMGIFTIRQRWEKITKQEVYVLTDTYLQPLYKSIPEDEYYFVDATVFPDPALIASLSSLNEDEAIADEKGIIAGRGKFTGTCSIYNLQEIFSIITTQEPVRRLEKLDHLFKWNDEMTRFDFPLVMGKRRSFDLNETVQEIKPSQIFIEDGAEVNFCILNASTGPIYIGKDAVIMERSTIRGPFVLGEGSVVKMGSKIYGATSVGQHCTIGGEIKNSIIMSYSNKAHDGYIGDSIIGEWCNIGAGTSNSNVKNSGGEVKLWNEHEQNFISAGDKCGIVMGDYSKTAINTSLNTGSVIGICCNVFGEGLTPPLIKDFSWGKNEKYDLDKAIIDIRNWKKFKNKEMTEVEVDVLKSIYK